MDDLPPSLQLEILNRLDDSADLARCRLASKTLNSLSHEIHSLKILCSYNRYLKSRTQSEITPFKLIVKKLLFNLKNLETISIAVENSLRDHEDGFDQSDDLYLTGVDFVSEWLPRIATNLKSISIVDLWIQSCWRESKVLSFISYSCNHLVELELKNASLSVEGLKPMLMLTNLTLEYIRLLDDEDLNKVNECFPCLRVLNLIGVGGLKEPKIHLLHLKTCHWTVSNYPDSLTMNTPNLIDLKLKCIKPRTLILKAPLLASLDLSIEKTSEVFEVEKFLSLKSLQIDSPDLYNLVKSFPDCNIVEKLVLDLPKRVELTSDVRENVNIDILTSAFPNVSCLVLRPGAWSDLEKCFLVKGLKAGTCWKRLKQLKAHLVVSELETTRSSISSLLGFYTTLTDVAMLVHRDVPSNLRWRLICSCIGDCPRIRWKWGMWKEGQEDAWLSDGI